MPIAAGEEWGNRWDFNKLVENHDIDYVRATLPNVGGITEMMKIAAHLRNAFRRHRAAFHRSDRHSGAGELSGHVLGSGADGVQLSGPRRCRICPVCLDFKNGKLYPNDRPGLGVELDMKQLQVDSRRFTQPVTARAQTYFRPDGSITNW